jgi:molybdopterin/thiamine biosynthesis adenylyltransferase
MTPAACIRVKNNLFVWQHNQTLYFQRSHTEGFQMGAGQIANDVFTTLQHTHDFNYAAELLSFRLGTGTEQAKEVFHQLVKASVLEYFDPETDKKETTERYSRQLGFFDSIKPAQHFNEVVDCQSALQQAHVFILGIGGIGNYAALSLAVMGVGQISVADGDVVENSNVSRQVLFSPADINRPKTQVAAEELQRKNPACRIHAHNRFIENKNDLKQLLQQAGKVNLIFVSADKPSHLVEWVDEVAAEMNIAYITCSYQGYTGFIGPLIVPGGKRFSQVVKRENIQTQHELTEKQNQFFVHPSTSATNGMLANMAVLESVKFLTGITQPAVLEKRLMLNMKTLELTTE